MQKCTTIPLRRLSNNPRPVTGWFSIIDADETPGLAASFSLSHDEIKDQNAIAVLCSAEVCFNLLTPLGVHARVHPNPRTAKGATTWSSNELFAQQLRGGKRSPRRGRALRTRRSTGARLQDGSIDHSHAGERRTEGSAMAARCVHWIGSSDYFKSTKQSSTT